MGCEEKGKKNPRSKKEIKQNQPFPTEDPTRILLTLLVRLIGWEIQLKLGHKKVILIQKLTQQLFPLRRRSQTL